jgi:methyl-accepting chemotaxis protein
MNWFINLRVAQKLAIGFGGCLLLALLAGAVALGRMGEMNANTKALVYEANAHSTLANALQRKGMELYIAELSIMPGNPPAARKLFMKSLPECVQAIDEMMDQYSKKAHAPQDIAFVKRDTADWAIWKSHSLKLVAAAAANNDNQCRSILGDQTPTLLDARALSIDRVAWNLEQSDLYVKKAEAAYQSGRKTMIALLLAALVIGIGLSIYITGIITGSLTVFSERLSSLKGSLKDLATNSISFGEGDFTRKECKYTDFLRWNRKDEFGDIANEFDEMLTEAKAASTGMEEARNSLAQLIETTRGAAVSIANISAELTFGNEDLSRRTSEQAASIEETVSSMEEMSSVVKQNAEHAKEACILSTSARSLAENGGEIVKNAVNSMQEINASSKRINDIVLVIDEIAFQTNLLALNAAVEAARVGEQGKGFAVVATEVRTLAGRSSTAAKEIKALVQDSVRKVDDGTVLVNQSGEQLSKIVGAVVKVAEIIESISSASQEQSVGIDQVNKAVVNFDKITQQNAALVEEAAASSSNMSKETARLQSLVSRFKLDNSRAATQQTIRRAA